MANERIPMGGDLIRHHVTNAPIAKDSMFYPIAEFLQSYSIPISKHVLMLWIAALVTILVSLWATRRYRKNIQSSPKGISHIYEMLLEFINPNPPIPNPTAAPPTYFMKSLLFCLSGRMFVII